MVEDYLLSREHRVGSAKARFFTQLGFDPQHWPALRDALLHFAREEAELGSATRFGQKYVVRGSIAGPSGRAEQIVVVWIILNGEDCPRFVTANPGAKS